MNESKTIDKVMEENRKGSHSDEVQAVERISENGTNQNFLEVNTLSIS